MSYGDFEYYKENAAYWHKQYRDAVRKADSAIAEAKKSKERELTAIRMMLGSKKRVAELEELLSRVRVLYDTAETQSDLNHGIYGVLKEISNG